MEAAGQAEEARAQEVYAAVLREAAAHAPAWRDRLQEALALVRAPDSNLEAEARARAAQAYGPEDAFRYRPEPAAISRLIELSTRQEDERAIVGLQEEACAAISAAKAVLLAALQEAKKGGQVEAVRGAGRRVNAMGDLITQVRKADRCVRSRMSAASRRVEHYRMATAVRELTPQGAAWLRAVPPTRAGYEQILDFYRLTDARQYSFGRAFGGPQHFVDVKRNVAILRAGRGPGPGGGPDTFEAYAVSGEQSPGLQLEPGTPAIFSAIACADGLGDTYSRGHDAEFKLVTALCHRFAGVRGPGDVRTDFCGDVLLWSKKPLCASCAHVVGVQLPKVLPNARVTVVVNDEAPTEAQVAGSGPAVPGGEGARADGAVDAAPERARDPADREAAGAAAPAGAPCVGGLEREATPVAGWAAATRPRPCECACPGAAGDAKRLRGH